MSRPFIRAAAAALMLIAAVIMSADLAVETRAARADSIVSILGSPEGNEGNSGFTNFGFNLSRAGDVITPCTVFYETADGTAFAPEDYASTSGSVAFGAGSAVAFVPVKVFGEIFVEGDETFTLRLVATSPGCTIGVDTGTAVIRNDEVVPPPGSAIYGIEGDVASTPGGLPDAAIRANDIVRLRRFILGLDVPTATEFQKADINANCGDGQINSADIALLRQWLLAGVGQIPNCGPSGPPQRPAPELRIVDHLDPADDMWPV